MAVVAAGVVVVAAGVAVAVGAVVVVAARGGCGTRASARRRTCVSLAAADLPLYGLSRQKLEATPNPLGGGFVLQSDAHAVMRKLINSTARHHTKVEPNPGAGRENTAPTGLRALVG